jgi:hypothetical protein
MSREKLGPEAARFPAANNMIARVLAMIARVFADIDLSRISMRSIYENFEKRAAQAGHARVPAVFEVIASRVNHLGV